MKNTKTPIGIEEIQKIKMTLEEKERILGNVLSSPIQITKPIKSPYSFVSMFQRNQFAYFGVILLLLVVLGGGNMAINYFQGENTEIARINTGGINAFPTNTNNFNNTMPTTNGTPKNKNTTSSPSLSSSPLAQNTNNGSVSSSGPSATMMAPTNLESSITIISPNGGEIYQQGQNIPITWNTKNIPANASIIPVFNYIDSNDIGEIHNSGAQSLEHILNTGNAVITPPTSLIIKPGKHYSITLVYQNYATGINAIDVRDSSDGLFTIQ